MWQEPGEVAGGAGKELAAGVEVEAPEGGRRVGDDAVQGFADRRPVHFVEAVEVGDAAVVVGAVPTAMMGVCECERGPVLLD